MASREPAFHSLQARGAAFFSLVFPEPDRPCCRCLDRTGLVELTSGAGYFWMRGYLFVDDHPYYARTDSQGNFTLAQVPPGAYDLVCWHPNWIPDVVERDADTFEITRMTFRAPLEVVRPLLVWRGGTARVDVSVSPSRGADAPLK